MKQTTRTGWMTRILCALALMTGMVHAGNTCTDGIMNAVPVPGGKAPVVDGDLSDWDRSGVVRCWNAEGRATLQNCSLYLMYDEEALYLGAEMALEGRAPINRNRHLDRYWNGDLIQMRICIDPAQPYPLPRADRRNEASPYVKNPIINCVNIWKNTDTGADNLYLTPGAFFDCENTLNPKDSPVKIVFRDGLLVFETRLSWADLGVADGKNPFRSGDMMTTVFDIKWCPGTDGHYTAAVFNKDPGAFAFLNPGTWGRVRFAPGPVTDVQPPTYAEIEARARAGETPREGARIAFTLPKKAKVSVNVFDEQGRVIRELAGGESKEPGEVEYFWDGRDALGYPCETGRTYRWGAYAHDGIDVTYFGTVGTSGNPPYNTPDGKGGWGADHGPAVAAAADESGRYFIWHTSESGKALVKTDFTGKTLWRSTPFGGGGYGSFSCATVADGKLYLVQELDGNKGRSAGLMVVDAAAGNFHPFPSGTAIMKLPIATNAPAVPADCAVRETYAFNCAGIAVIGGEVFVGDYTGGRILVCDAVSGEVTRELPVAGVRGLAVHDGALLAAVLPAAVLSVDPASGATRTLLAAADGLEAPYGVTAGPDGALYVTDLGASQQVRKYAPKADGSGYTPVYTVGRRGGRGLMGRLDPDGFRCPFGIALDSHGTLMVCEASPPKIISLIDAATGTVKERYYGYTSYSPTNIPDCDDPLVNYYSLSGPDCFARARIPAEGGKGYPDACWDFMGAGIDDFASVMNTMNTPEIIRASNGLKYLVPDGAPDHRHPHAPMTICRIDGDVITPVAAVLRGLDTQRKKAFRLWTDLNGDGRLQEDELSPVVDSMNGQPFSLVDGNGAVHMDADGNLFIPVEENYLIGFPSRGFTEAGVPRWDVADAYIAIPVISPDMTGRIHASFRSGVLGIRRDSAGNFYTVMNCSPQYVTPEYTRYMRQGMGHTADCGGVYIFKHDPQGRLLWRVGRKAIDAKRPGEMLHHWCIAGLLGDHYVVAASEWGVFTVYTADGFYVDHLFDVPGLPGRGVPYSFGGEDFSGQIRYFPARDEVWAYNAGHVFRVQGFEKGRVLGEWRTEGTVTLEQVLPLRFPGSKARALSGVRLVRENGCLVFTAHVADDTPLVNVGQGAADAFKGGDGVGFQIGPSNRFKELPMRTPKGRQEGYTRILAVRQSGVDRVYAWQPFTKGPKAPNEYSTPAGGRAPFEFVGEVPGASVTFTPDADGKGYAARISVPESFFGLTLPGRIYYDAEALFSGEGGRGLQAVRREYLHTPDSSEATMVDDVPTESRLRPQGWQPVELN